MALKPQDMVAAIALGSGMNALSYAELGKSLGLSASEAHASVHRLQESGLVSSENKRLHRKVFLDFVRYGLPYVFAVKPGPITRGIPTAWAADVLKEAVVDDSATIPVWPDPSGNRRGASIKPLPASAPQRLAPPPEGGAGAAGGRRG